MKKLILLWTKTTYVATFILFLLCLSFSCQQQVEEGLTEEEAKALVERDMEIYNEGNLTLLNEHIDSNYVQHYAGKENIEGIDAFKEYVTNLRTGYPDFHLSVEELIIKDDRIVWRWIITGTLTGTWNDIPPTGKNMRVEGVGILRVVDGKIVERLLYFNEASMLIQLGFTITPPEIQAEQ